MSQVVKCSAGHDSTEPDYCSVCGVEIASNNASGLTASGGASAGPASGGAPASASAAHEHCPKCKAEREDPSSPFCGTCGYNFVTKVGGDVAAIEPVKIHVPALSASAQPAAASTATPASNASRMDISISVDFSRSGAPSVRSSATFPLFDEESLIGRKGSSARQTVAIEDPAVSSRHLLILRNADSTYAVRDINSTNGTKVNGVELKAGVDSPLKEGDVIAIGEFTLITVLAIR